jgi:hypothetical protein
MTFQHVICNQTRKVLERRTANRNEIVSAWQFSARCFIHDKTADVLPYEILDARNDAIDDAAYALAINNYRLAVDHLRTFWKL